MANDIPATEPPRPQKAEIHPLEPEQLDKLLAAAEDHKDKWLYMFAAYTGLREGELLALTWSAVGIDDMKPYARVQQTVGYINKEGFVFRPLGKTKKSRREIALLDKAVYALRQRKKQQLQEKLSAAPGEYQESDLIFSDWLGRPLDPSGLARRFKHLATKTGFPGVRFHDLRHSFATMMLKLGVHPKIVQEMLGHETISITMDTYSHVIKGMQQEAVAKVNDYLNSKLDTSIKGGL